MPPRDMWARNSDESTFASRNEAIFNNPPGIIQIPGGFFPQTNFKDALWITLQAKELKGIKTGQRGGNLTLGEAKTKFKFLAPPEILEMHNHDWQEYASLGSRMLEKIKSLQTLTQQGGQYLSGMSKSGAMAEIKKIINQPSLLGATEAAGTAAGKLNVNVPNRKVDTPLAYSNSQRRQLQLTFVLADNEGGKSVVKAVKLLMFFAAAATNNVIGIDFPHIFKVASEPEGLILFEHAALTSVQPTWLYPFVNGYPTRCDLTINMTDMSPLFQRTITEGTIINVNPSEKNSEFTNPGTPPVNTTRDPRSVRGR